MIDCHARPFSTCCGCPTPLHCSFDTTSALHSRRGWLSRPPSAAAPRVSWPLMPDQFRVRLILRARQQTTRTKKAMDILAGPPNIGHPFSRPQPRHALYTTPKTNATSARDACRVSRHLEQRVGDVLVTTLARSYWTATIRTTRHSIWQPTMASLLRMHRGIRMPRSPTRGFGNGSLATSPTKISVPRRLRPLSAWPA